ncbi:MAG: TlpA family protein disulfide reductase [Acidobacteriota bacterium]
MNKINVIAVIIFFFFIGIVTNGHLAGEGAVSAPSFSLTDIQGNTLTLNNLKGKVIFLNFWATWCPPCRQEIPGFIDIYEKYKDQGMVIIGVSLDRTGEGVVKKFVQENNITYPIAMATSALVDSYQPGRFIPTTIFIGHEGNIQGKHVGYLDKETLEKHFLELKEKD